MTSLQKCVSKLRRSHFKSAAMNRAKKLGGVDISTAGTCPVLIALRNKWFLVKRFLRLKIQYWRRRITIYLCRVLSNCRTVTHAFLSMWALRSLTRNILAHPSEEEEQSGRVNSCIWITFWKAFRFPALNDFVPWKIRPWSLQSFLSSQLGVEEK